MKKHVYVIQHNIIGEVGIKQVIGVFASRRMAELEVIRLNKLDWTNTRDFFRITEEYFDDSIYTKR